jgi:hypothetical protein
MAFRLIKPKFNWRKRRETSYTNRLRTNKGAGTGQVGIFVGKGEFRVQQWQVRKLVIPSNLSTFPVCSLYCIVFFAYYRVVAALRRARSEGSNTSPDELFVLLYGRKCTEQRRLHASRCMQKCLSALSRLLPYLDERTIHTVLASMYELNSHEYIFDFLTKEMLRRLEIELGNHFPHTLCTLFE